MKRLALVMGLLASSIAHAEGQKSGWGFEFNQDTFDGTIFPVAIMSQNGEGFDKALLAIACGLDGNLRASFQASAIISFNSSNVVEFKAADGVKSFNFSIGNIPHFGRHLILSAADTNLLLDIFEAANGSDVPFRTESKQGTFSSVGAPKTVEILKQHCPK